MNSNVLTAIANLSDELNIELASSLYAGINGYKKDGNMAKTILKKIAGKGNPEAQYQLYTIFSSENRIKEAIKMLLASAEQGHPHAKTMLFLEYVNGNVKNISEEQAVIALMEAADEEISYALYLLSRVYNEGDFGVEKDYEMSRMYCKKSADLGFPAAQYALYYYYKAEDRELAIKWLKKAAEGGDEDAQYTLWKELSNEAVYWLNESKNQKNIDAVYDFARLQETDVIINKDFADSIQTYKNLIFYDYKPAANRLVRYQELNKYNENYEYIISNLLEYEAYDSLATICFDQVIKGIEIEQNLNYLEQAASKDNTDSLYSLSIFYNLADQISGAEKYIDTAKAYTYLLKSAELGNTLAQESVFDEYYRETNNIKISKDKALKFLYESAKKGNPDALNTLGIINYYGRIIPKDEDKAVDCFIEAAEHGSALANYNLGRAFENVNKIDQAIIYYMEGLRNNDSYSMKKIIELWENGYLESIDKKDIDAIREEYSLIQVDDDTLSYYIID